jgi:hypothetical protein
MKIKLALHETVPNHIPADPPHHSSFHLQLTTSNTSVRITLRVSKECSTDSPSQAKDDLQIHVH